MRNSWKGRTISVAMMLEALTWTLMALPPDARAWRFEIDGGNTDTGYRIAVDGSGDIVAAGTLVDNSGFDWYVTKRNGVDGTEVWSERIDVSLDIPYALAVDGGDNVLVAGNLDAAFGVIKFTASGSELWRRNPVGTHVSGGGGARAVVADASGNVIAAGQLQNTGSYDLAVVKYSPAGTLLWQKTFEGGSNSSGDLAKALATDASGNVIVMGQLVDGILTAGNWSVLKLASATGNVMWQKTLDGEGRIGRSLGVDSSGDVLLAGQSVDYGSGDVEYAVVKLDGASGTEEWRYSIAEVETGNESPYADGLVVDAAGNVSAVGRADGDMVVVKLSSTGTLLWRRDVEQAVPSSSGAIALDPNGDVMAAGRAFRFNGVRFYVTKIDGVTGQVIWDKGAVGGIAGSNEAHFVATDPMGNAFAIGDMWNETLSDIAIVSFHADNGTVGPIAAKKLLVKDKTGSPAKRKIVALGKDPTVTTDALGSGGDPILNGAAVRLVNPTTTETVTFNLPSGAAWWTALGPDGSLGYRYKDPTQVNGPCKLVLLRTGKLLKAVCKGADIPFTLDETTQDTLTLSVQLGTAAPQCLVLTSAAADSGTGSPSGTGIFRGTKAPALGSCPVP